MLVARLMVSRSACRLLARRQLSSAALSFSQQQRWRRASDAQKWWLGTSRSFSLFGYGSKPPAESAVAAAGDEKSSSLMDSQQTVDTSFADSASTVTTNGAPLLPDSSMISEALSSFDAQAAVGPLAQATELLESVGLGYTWPHGLVQYALTLGHQQLGLPWWGSILALVFVCRLALLPVQVCFECNQ